MSFNDRDWYRDEVAKRLRQRQQPRRGKWPDLPRRANWRDLIRGLFAVMAIVLAVFVTFPVTLTSRCDLGEWRTTPVQCWRSGWAALGGRIAGNQQPPVAAQPTIRVIH
jgi:hypothetical protein